MIDHAPNLLTFFNGCREIRHTQQELPVISSCYNILRFRYIANVISIRDSSASFASSKSCPSHSLLTTSSQYSLGSPP